MISALLGAAFAGIGATVFVVGLLATLYLPLALAYTRWEARVLRVASNEPAWPRVSVLVPAFNEERTIALSLRSVLDSDYPDFEVVVVDDGSRDGTLAALASFGDDRRVRVLTQPNAGKGAALNRALGAATGEIVLFTDADTLFERDTIRAGVAYFAAPGVEAVGGNDTPLHPRGWLQKMLVVTSHIGTGFVRRALSMVGALPIIPGNLGFVRTATLRRIGGFATLWGEDLELTWRLHRHGARIVYGAQARVLAECPGDLAGLWRQRVRWVRSYIKIARLNRDMLGSRRHGTFGPYLLLNTVSLLLVPVLQLLALLLMPWAIWSGQAPAGAFAWLAYLGLFTLYGIALVAIALDRAWRHLRYLPHLAFMVPLSAFYSAVVVFSGWKEWRAEPELWNKLERRDIADLPAETALPTRRQVIVGGAVAFTTGAGALLLRPTAAIRPAFALPVRARGAGPTLAVSVHFADWDDWRDSFETLVATPAARHVARVGVTAGRPDWTYFRALTHRDWWSRTQVAEERDMLQHAEDVLQAQGLETTAMLDVFAPRYLRSVPSAAATGSNGVRSNEIVCSTELATGVYGDLTVSTCAALARRTHSDSIAITELFYDTHCFCDRCERSFGERAGRRSWPRSASGAIEITHEDIGRWRSEQVASVLQRLRAVTDAEGKRLLLDVKLSRDAPDRASAENGQDYGLMLRHVDSLVAWDYFALDDIPAAQSAAVARDLVGRIGANRYWHSIGMWGRNRRVIDPLPMRTALAAAIEGGARQLWITPARQLGAAHWSAIDELWSTTPGRTT